jgi:hypothetical protein
MLWFYHGDACCDVSNVFEGLDLHVKSDCSSLKQQIHLLFTSFITISFTFLPLYMFVKCFRL